MATKKKEIIVEKPLTVKLINRDGVEMIIEVNNLMYMLTQGWSEVLE